jgi:hypothetical protein
MTTTHDKELVNIHTNHHEWRELMDIVREGRAAAQKVLNGVLTIQESQVHVMSVLEELKPLRQLPVISDNLTKIVNQLIAPATRDNRRTDWFSVFSIATLAVICMVLILKDVNFKGLLKVWGNEAQLESSQPEKKTN